MRFVIIGAGGIGAYYGARLLAGGQAVSFVARGGQLEALQTAGLTVRHPDFDFQRHVEALDWDGLASRPASQFDAVLLCLKAMGTEEAARHLAQWMGAAPVPVLSLQNGVDNEPALAAVLGAGRVLGGLAVRIGAHVVAPGVIEAVGPGHVIFGPWPQDDGAASPASMAVPALRQAFVDAGVPVRVSDDIRTELWRKLVINNGVNPLSALTGLDTGALTRQPDLARIVRGMMRETVQAAAGDGAALEPQDAEAMFALISGFDPIKTSMLVDREHGRELELEAICGAVLRRSDALGVEAPYTFAIHALLKHAASRE